MRKRLVNVDPLTLTFTVDEWRLLAIAAHTSQLGKFTHGIESVHRLRELARRIAKETGKHA